MPDVTPEAQTTSQPVIRADIAKMVGLDPEKAAEIAKQRAQEAQVVRISRQNGEKAYETLVGGQQIDSIALGVGQFDLSPTDKVEDVVPNIKKRVHEINPPPPQEHIKLFLDSFATKALEDKNFEAAVACYNYITDEQLTTEENRLYLEKLAASATSLDEKYDLGLALQQVLPQETVTEEPKVLTSSEIPQPPTATTPIAAATVEADEAAWRAAAGISPATSEPKAPTAAPLQPDASILSYTPPAKAEPEVKTEEPAPMVTPTMEPLPQASQAKVSPSPTPIPVDTTPTEQAFPQPQPITVPTPAPRPFETTPPVANNNLPNLRPVPTRAEAAAQGLIED